VVITVPAGPPRKSSDIDSKTCMKLVINALMSVRSTAESRVVELERTDMKTNLPKYIAAR